MSTWGPPPAQEHTFSTGRTATLRGMVNVYEAARNSGLGLAMVGHLEQASKGELRDASVAVDVMEAICVTLWLKPEVMLTVDEREPVEGELIPFSWLATDEINETVELFMASFSDAARFRDGAGGTGNGASGKGVGGASKPASRPRARKRAGVGG